MQTANYEAMMHGNPLGSFENKVQGRTEGFVLSTLIWWTLGYWIARNTDLI